MRSVLGVISGYLIFAMSAGLLFYLSGQDAQAIPSLGYMAFSILYGIGFAMLGGYLAAAYAKRREIFHAGCVAGIIAVLSVVSVVAMAGTEPLWSPLAALFLMAPAALAGGYLRKRTSDVWSGMMWNNGSLSNSEQEIAPRLRAFVLSLLVLALLGTAAELILTVHFEGISQQIPLIVIALSGIVLIWQATTKTVTSLAALRAVMVISIVSGFAGIYLHYMTKVGFQLESNKNLAGWELFEKAIKAKNPPILAPGMMVQMGLLGLIYAFRYPVRRNSSNQV